MKAITRIAIVIMMLLVIGCGDSTQTSTPPPAPVPEPLPEDAVTFYLGDTITLDCLESYPEFWDDNRINTAIDGAAIQDVHDLWNDILKHGNPDNVVILIGGNDAGNHSILYNDMDLFLSTVDVPAKVIGILPTSFEDTNTSIALANPYISDLAAAHGFDYIDLWPVMSAGGFIIPEYTTDGTRLTPAGCRAYLDNTTGAM